MGRTVSLAINQIEIDNEMNLGRPDETAGSRVVKAYLESVQLQLADAMQAWNEVHPEALRELMEEIEEQ